MRKKKISIIIPVFNEEENIKPLYQKLLINLKKLSLSWEIIFVDDGSTDNTFKELQKLKKIKIIQLRKNFGQSAALDAGIKNAQGEVLITMDGDGQNDPQDIPFLLKKLKKGYDVVCGWRHPRKDPFFRKIITWGANFLGQFLVNPGVHDSGCALRAYRKESFENLDLYGEMHRMIPALLRWRGFKITEIKVNHRPRKYGQSKYGWKRIFKGFLDMINVWFWRKYETRPMHIFGSLGLLLTFFGLTLLFLLAGMKIFLQYSLSNKIWPLVGFSSIITGIQFLVFGILAQIIIQSQPTKHFYSIKQILEK